MTSTSLDQSTHRPTRRAAVHPNQAGAQVHPPMIATVAIATQRAVHKRLQSRSHGAVPPPLDGLVIRIVPQARACLVCWRVTPNVPVEPVEPPDEAVPVLHTSFVVAEQKFTRHCPLRYRYVVPNL